MTVKTWNNGNPNNETGAGYGIKVNIEDFNTLEHWEILIVGNNNINRGNLIFNINCREIRHRIIGIFLIENNLNNWEYGEPNVLYVHEIRQNVFELKTTD